MKVHIRGFHKDRRGVERAARSGRLSKWLAGKENKRKQRVAKLLAQSKFSAGVQNEGKS